MDTLDDEAIAELMQQRVSQREIAKRLNISRSTLRRHLEKRKSTPRLVQNDLYGTPTVHQWFPFADELTQAWSEIQELLAWHREHKQFLALALDTSRKRRRQTYHVEERFIEAIRRAADLERTDLAEIVNRAFERYFTTF